MILFIFFFKVSAQETRFGVKGGLNCSSIVGDLTEGIKFRFSGHAGVFLELEFSDKFAFQPELLYSSQGFQFSTDLASIENNPRSDESDFRTNVQLNYLTVPLMAKFSLGRNYWLEFGPQFGFLLNQVTKIKSLNEPNPSVANERSGVSGDFRLDYGLAAGLGLEISEQFSLSPRVYLALRNRLDTLDNPPQNYNVSIQLSANYKFR